MSQEQIAQESQGEFRDVETLTPEEVTQEVMELAALVFSITEEAYPHIKLDGGDRVSFSNKGADGITVRHTKGRNRYISWSEVDREGFAGGFCRSAGMAHDDGWNLTHIDPDNVTHYNRDLVHAEDRVKNVLVAVREAYEQTIRDKGLLSLEIAQKELQEAREALWAEGLEILLAAPQQYIDVDVEADGKPGHGNMLSIGAQAPTGESFYREVKPLDDMHVPHQRQFCEEHGLGRERLMEEAPDYEEVMREFAEWTRQLQKKYRKPTVFTAFNAGFDFGFVDAYFAKAGIKNPYGIAPFDLKSRALGLDGSDWDFRKTAKAQLPEEIVPSDDFTHHALEDAQYQQRIHCGLVALVARQSLDQS